MQRCRGAEVQTVQRCRVGAGAGKKVQWLYKGAKEVQMQRQCRCGAEVLQRLYRAGAEMQRQCKGSSQGMMRVKVLRFCRGGSAAEVVQRLWCRGSAEVVQQRCRVACRTGERC